MGTPCTDKDGGSDENMKDGRSVNRKIKQPKLMWGDVRQKDMTQTYVQRNEEHDRRTWRVNII